MNQHSEPEQQVFDISDNRNPKAFSETLTLTRKGDVIIYHTGLFAAGAHKAPAVDAYVAGLVTLIQRRRNTTGNDRFEYIAQRTSKKWKTK